MCLAQGPQHSDASEAQTRGLSVLSQALHHLATSLPWVYGVAKVKFFHNIVMLHTKLRDITDAGTW